MKSIEVNDVIQGNENAGEWIGCLMMVEEVTSYGVMASLKIPYKGNAYIRLTNEQYDYIGKAVMIPAERTEENE